jgi:hypothetical protein
MNLTTIITLVSTISLVAISTVSLAVAQDEHASLGQKIKNDEVEPGQELGRQLVCKGGDISGDASGEKSNNPHCQGDTEG